MTEPTPLLPPRPIPPHGKLAVLAISSPSKPDRIERAASRLRGNGFEVVLAENLYAVERSYLAGSDETRLREINRFLADPSFDAFLFARGGYGAMRILERIDYSAISERPRPIIGYSDLTALHQAVAIRTGVGTFHGPMLNGDFYDGLPTLQEEWMWKLLRGEAPIDYRFDADQVLSEGSADGILFGGCLSLTTALMGTPYDFWIPGGIWFWEDVDEPTYRIDRMLTQLRLSGRFRSIRGLLIGKLKGCGGSDTQELDQMLGEFFSDCGIPVIRNLPFGHHGDNLLMPIGTRVKIDTRGGLLTVLEPATVPAVRSEEVAG